MNPKQNNSDDKRLEIDLEGLRDPLWFYADGRPKDSVKEQQHDQVRWIDTSTMLCDPLTKYGEKDSRILVTAYSTGFMDLEATAESEMRKMKARKSRQNAKEEKKVNSTDKYLGSKKQYLRDNERNIKRFQTVTGTWAEAFDMNTEMDQTERRSKEQYMLDRFGKKRLQEDTEPERTRKKQPVRNSVSP